VIENAEGNSGNGNHPAHPAQPTQPTSDLSAFDLYYVCLHVANLVISAENAGLAPAITRRFQRLLEEVIAEYDTALSERDALEARFQA
jgi:hypothetical protein